MSLTDVADRPSLSLSINVKPNFVYIQTNKSKKLLTQKISLPLNIVCHLVITIDWLILLKGDECLIYKVDGF